MEEIERGGEEKKKKGMGSKWRKAKQALGLNMCLYAPRTHEHDEEQEEDIDKDKDNGTSSMRRNKEASSSSSSSALSPARFSDAVQLSPVTHSRRPTTPSSSGLKLPRPSSSPSNSSSKETCAICLTTLKMGHGHAIFTAECSHSFHFQCITSSVKHGNQICPICRAKWKEVPFEIPPSDSRNGRRRIHSTGLPRDDAWTTVLRRLPAPRVEANRHVPSFSYAHEPIMFNDDEALEREGNIAENTDPDDITSTVEVKVYPEFSAVERSAFHDDFAMLVHIKAPVARRLDADDVRANTRASVDLVTVLDVSGSMAGTKLALLKRAMAFVIQNLGPSDRLSVVVFSSTARRILPLRRMTEVGRQDALQAINSLTCNGGTNIAEGLKKGGKVIVDRKWKNPVASVILLSDGQDTYTVKSPRGTRNGVDYKSLLPASMHRNGGSGIQIPVHAFGFGSDHDASSMHSISETSGGTFSFIEAEGAIQDAFAQCIGGLLSVMVQELHVNVECIHPNLRINSLKAGSYRTNIAANGRTGSVNIGDLYAEEERDFLVTVNIPVDLSGEDMSVLKVGCKYKEPVTEQMIALEAGDGVRIHRPEMASTQVVSIEVDRQRNRLCAAEAMAEARLAAENGDLSRANSILENCYNSLLETASGKAGDRLCASLCAELKEMQERMASRRVYETSGRAYVLSGLSSHSWQRATARGDSTESTSLVQAYQTPSMVDMLTRSQTMILGKPLSSQRTLRQALSFPASKLQPR